MRGALRRTLPVVALLAVAVVAVAIARLTRSVQQAMAPVRAHSRPLLFTPVQPPKHPLDHWGGSDVDAVAATPEGLLIAGASGVSLVSEAGHSTDLSAGLPSLAATSLVLWRGNAVAALRTGGFYLRRGTRWEEARSGWGALEVRTLAESPAGELFVGARQGLFRAAWASASLELLDSHPVRSIALGGAVVLIGGEEGTFRIETGRVVRLETAEAWSESVAVNGRDALVLTASGLVRGPSDGSVSLQPVAGGDDLASGVAKDGAFYGISSSEPTRVRRVGEGRISEEILPFPARRLLLSEGVLFADTEGGLLRREAVGWKPTASHGATLPSGPSHVTALAWLRDELVAGLFDGGLAVGKATGTSLAWRSVPGSVWGVNALMSAGSVVHVASLRGAARFDGVHLTPVEGPGAAFSLAATNDGIVIGYGQGVLLPGSHLLSAFHGLPGNQALALASGEALFVGTPSGLGAVDSGRVKWRVASGEGKLPHPWVTALLVSGSDLFVGTYGGGVVRRRASGAAVVSGTRLDPAAYEPFVDTEGLKINTGCLVEAAGRIYAGTDGQGLLRLSKDRQRFEPLALALPSPRVTALLPGRDALFIGTDQGIARLPLAAEGADYGTEAE